MAEQPPEGVDTISAFLNDDPHFASIEMISALEGYIFSGYEDDHRTNSSSSSTGSITEAADEQSDIDDDEFAHVNTEAEQGRVSRRNTGNYSANNGSRRTGSIDEAGQEPDAIGEGDAADSDGPSQASPIVITSAQWPPSDPMFFFNTHLRDKNLLYGNLEMHKNNGLAHLFTAIETVAIILYHSTGPRSKGEILCECIQMSIHYVTQLFERGRFKSTDFIRSFPTSVLLSLLQVNRQIYLEAVGLFYYKNHFYCYGFADLHSFVKAISSSKPVLGIDRSQFINRLSFNFNFEDRKKAAEVLKIVFEKFYNLKELGVYIDEERWEMFKKKDRTPFYHSPEKYTGIDAFY
ncbi:hypothetical protein KC316_g10041, partial [Hortaea werneckii]